MSRRRCWSVTACRRWPSRSWPARRGVGAGAPDRDGARIGRRLRLLRMAGGQAIDLASVGLPLTQPELELMHALKTGALIRAGHPAGASAATPWRTTSAQRSIASPRRAGLLFQVVDDIPTARPAPPRSARPPARCDAAADKPTYVSLLGVEGARRFAGELEADALDSLKPFGARSLRLAEPCGFIAHRKFEDVPSPRESRTTLAVRHRFAG